MVPMVYWSAQEPVEFQERVRVPLGTQSAEKLPTFVGSFSFADWSVLGEKRAVHPSFRIF